MNYKDVKNIISQRQSLFVPQMAENKTIEEDKIWQLLELANYAPSHRRTNPWRFIVFQNESKLDFFKTLAAIYKSSTLRKDYDSKKEQKILSKAKNVSVVIAVGMNRCSKESVPVFEEQWSVACAVQNILLGMKSLGIIGYWSTPKIAFSKEMKSYLKLEDNDQCMGFLQLGLPREDLLNIPQQLNGSIKEKVTWR